ncbi:MAG TPA: MFS transporter [Steroidobacteraceae bacterium]|jgi:MFS family permease|nr:MFS transporter [Steroidobacteraceae bacterium]
MSELQSSVAADASALGATVPQSASLIERWYVLIMMCLVYTLSIADRYVVSTVLDPIRIELHLTDQGVALLTGLAFGLFYVVLGFPLSWLIDRYNRRRIVGVCLVVWSAMTAVCGLARSSLEFFLARVGVTIGEAGGTPGANSLLSDYFPATRRAMALTVFSLGAPIGAWLGYNVAGGIADHYGWRAAFYALGLPGVLVGIGVWLTVREPKRGCLDSGRESLAPSVAATLRFMWVQRAAVHTMIGTAVCALWGWGLMFWTPAFLQRTYHMSVGQASEVTQNMHLWGGGLATVATGILMARSSMIDARRIVWVLAIGIGIATIASGVVYWTRDLALAKAMLWIFIPSIYFYIGPGFGLLNNLAPCRMRAMFCAMVLFLANLGNLVIAPPLIGTLSDYFAPNHVPNADSLRLAMLCLVPTGLWATAHLVLATRDILKDQERARDYP